MVKRESPSGEDRFVPGEDGLRRWSRLKRKARAEEVRSKPSSVAETEKTAALTPATEAEQKPATEAEQKPATEAEQKDNPVKDLPPIESLGKDSDYTPFLQDGVPEETRVKALRQLWKSDAMFREPFPFEMHMEDYHATFQPIDALKDTIYKVGLGYLTREDIAAWTGDDDKEKKSAAIEGEIASGEEKSDEKQAGEINQSDSSGAAAPDSESSAEGSAFPDKKEGKIADAREKVADKSDKPA